MLKFIFAVALLCAAVFIGPRLADSQGFVHIATNSYIIETSITTAVIVLVVAFILVHILFNLLKGFLGLPTNTARFFNKRREAKQVVLQAQANDAYEEGAYKRTLTIINKIDSKEKLPLGCLYLAAKSSFKLGKFDECRDFLDLAQKHEQSSSSACNLLRAKLNLQVGNTQAAIEYLDKLKQDSTMQHQVTVLLAQAYEQACEYQKLAELLPNLEKLNIKTEEENERLARTCAIELSKKAKDGEQLNTLVAQIPKVEKKNPEFMTPFLTRMVELGNVDEASKLAVELLRHTSSNTLLNSIATWDKANSSVLEELQRMLNSSLDKPNPPLLKALANLEIKSDKLDKAQEHINKLLESNNEPSRDVCYLAAELNEKKLNYNEASKYFLLARKSSN